MATIKHKPRQKLTDPNVFTEWHRYHLLHGHAFFGGGYGDHPDATTMQRMRTDWRRHRAELMRQHALEPGSNSGPGTRAWAWWMFEHNIPPPGGFFEQMDFLQKHGLLTVREKLCFSDDETFTWDSFTEVELRSRLDKFR
jgi:hypothetical protein